ncbi:MAG: tetratricopeptide repeat protein, partial [Fibrobacteria bacterium]|nr:tetratricopeptide repeat protein [Fibrobacteria bacterium]
MKNGNVFFNNSRFRVSEQKISKALIASSNRPGPVPLIINYPFDKSLFPPDFTMPLFVWHDMVKTVDSWLVDVSFEGLTGHFLILTEALRVKQNLDSACIRENNNIPEAAYDLAARNWAPEPALWDAIKSYSTGKNAVITIRGLTGLKSDLYIASQGIVTIQTSEDSVAAPIFYRDVPLMPTTTETGVVKPLADDALHLISWRLRDVSQVSAPVLLTDMPTCANCHSFSRDGKTLGMDMDGPQGDKGAYALKDIAEHMNITQDDVFSWNDFNKKQTAFGLFSRVSPDGRYVISAVDEKVFVANYMDFRFLQTFYPTRAKLAYYDRESGNVKLLPGASNPDYVQCNPVWSPDGKEIVFLRAKAKPSYEGLMPQKALDPDETQIKYDVYRMPFNNGKGGNPEAVFGASGNGMSNSFPKFSPDGKWIVYVQSKNGLLMRPDSKLYIIPAGGGVARELACNFPIMNSWHSWSPNSRWLVFSSKGMRPFTQMFLTHIDEFGKASPAILIPHSTADNRAVNLPEFVNIEADGIKKIIAPAADYQRYLDRAKDLILEGKVAEALELAQRAVKSNKDYADAQSTLAYVLQQQGKLDEAEQFYKAAIENNSADHAFNNNDFNYVNLGVILNHKRQYNQAISVFNKAVKENPKSVSAYYNWGVALAGLEKPDSAISLFVKALELSPELSYAHIEIGRIYTEKGEHKKAVQEYYKALRKGLTNYRTYLLLGSALEAVNDFDGALTQYNQAIKQKSTDGYLYNKRAQLYYKKGELKKSIGEYTKALKYDKNNP